ncbi:MAG: ABC transporter transmembrane domain-containing protein [Rhizobiaceae bacterium]
MHQIEPNLLKYIWQNSKKEQLWMLVVILLSMPTYFLSLDLPKRIVNGPIQGRGFENPDDTAFFLTTNLPLPDWMTGGPIQIFPGFELDRVAFLMALSVTFLCLVAANGMFKLYINTFKGRMGERILRRFRFQLFDRVLRYPLPRFRRTKASEIASMIKDEVEPMGEFIGDAFTQPLFLGGQAITGLTFIFLQNVMLGVVTLVVVLFQAWLVPRLRRRLIQLNKKRQIESRQLAGRLGEIVEGIQDAHANDTTNLERADISGVLGRLFFIRFELFQRKFSVKYINNLLIQFLAFLFYAAGGYLAIRGTLDIGQLVAVIAAYKDLPDPIRGLIDYDQQRLTVDARYTQIVEQFASEDLQDPESQKIAEGPVPALSDGFDISHLQVIDETGSKLIEKASVSIGLNETVAVIGAVNSGATHFTEVIARMLRHTSGKVELDGKSLPELPEYITGRRLAYIDGGTFFPSCTINEALTYVLKNQPLRPLAREKDDQVEYETQLAEARRAGNSDLDFMADWIDIERIGAKDEAGLEAEIRKVLADVDMEDDIRALGLRGTLDPNAYPELCEQLIAARHTFRGRLPELGFDGFVEPFDPDAYNNQATLGENLLFGTSRLPAYEPSNLPSNRIVRAVLAKAGLEQRLFDMGKEVAATTVELFGDLSSDNPFFDQLNYMDAEELPEYRGILNRIGTQPMEQVAEKDRLMIMKLPFAYTEVRNRMGLLDEDMKAVIVSARHQLRETLEGLENVPVNFYDPDKYNPAASVIDNVLLGRVSATMAEGPEMVTSAIRVLLDEMGLTPDIFRIGLSFNMGSGGKRLSETQRQKLHLARALLKKPDFLIVNQALNTLDARNQRKIIQTVLARAAGRDGERFGVIWSPMNLSFAEMFDRVLMFDKGVLIDDGSPKKLQENSTTFRELIGA